MTIDDWAEGREGKPAPKPVAETEEPEELTEAEEVAQEVAKEKAGSSPFASIMSFGKRIEKWMNEGID